MLFHFATQLVASDNTREGVFHDPFEICNGKKTLLNCKKVNTNEIIALTNSDKTPNEILDIYKKNNRKDLLEVEQKESEILSGYLPKQLSEEETKKICTQTVSALGANSIKDMGKVMGTLKKEYSDSLDFSKAGSYLKEILGKE